LPRRRSPPPSSVSWRAFVRALRLGFQAGKVFRVPPFPSITVNNAREVYFERDEFERLLAELPKDFRSLVTLAY
jgi:DNA-directed RNA polymerase specialized sigma24 family protein